MQLLISPQTKPLSGELTLPGDKSISHRALMLAAISDGVCAIKGFLPSLDCLATLQALQQCGVKIKHQGDQVEVEGVGLQGLHQPQQSLDCGNSGTTIRLLAGLLAGQNVAATLIGDASLQARPMQRVIEPLVMMGAQIQSQSGLAPLAVHGNLNLQGIAYTLPIASAQVKSALLLAGLTAAGETFINEPQACRDHTERLLQYCGIQLTHRAGCYQLRGLQQPRAFELAIPSDLSSAAFFMVAASIIPGSKLTLKKVGINPTRSGIINCLQRMGADITFSKPQHFGLEPVADITVRHARLRGIAITADEIPATIDELPILMIAAAHAEGTTSISGADELRMKESDRINAMVQGLTQLGVNAIAQPDGAIIEGGQLQGGEIDSHYDHRVALGFCIAALRAQDYVTIAPADCIATSFPGFTALAQTIGIEIHEH